MRRCDYCGGQNPEGAELCAGCGTELAELPPAIVSASAEATPATADVPDAWSARHAWKCLGMTAVFLVVIGLLEAGFERQIPEFRRFSESGPGHFVFSMVICIAFVLNMLYFARTETMRAFLAAFSLERRRLSNYLWFILVATFLLRCGSHIMVRVFHAKGLLNTGTWGFAHTPGWQRYFYLAPTLLAPFWEELYFRGFIYRAFRGSYSILVSTLLIVGLTALTHWPQFYQSGVAVIVLSGLAVLLCFLRERTDNLWECILCHLLFNATGVLASEMRR